MVIKMKHTIVATVDNIPGVVSRISGLFTRRGYNIEGLVTSVTDNERIYHLTITVIGTDEELEQIINQLEHVSEVIEVYELDHTTPHVTREMMFLKLSAMPENTEELVSLCEELKCRVIGLGGRSAVIEVTGEPERLDEIKERFRPFGIIAVARSGAMSMLI